MLSYESKVFRDLAFPSRDEVIHALLKSMLNHRGVVREFGSDNQAFVDHLADSLGLTDAQRSFRMETIVRKEGRIKTFAAWHRLLFRAADLAAKRNLLAHPKETLKLTGRREWMLTEKGIDKALSLSGMPINSKQDLPVITYEVQRVKDALEHAKRIEDYDPIDTSKKSGRVTRESLLRTRGFRQAILQAYDYRCSVCGLKLTSPDSLSWEVEAAHIVPHRYSGRDDIWNGLALCRFHHWSFDVGWFTLRQDLTIEVDPGIHNLPTDQGVMGEIDVLRGFLKPNAQIIAPKRKSIFPHSNSISWHRANIFGSV